MLSFIAFLSQMNTFRCGFQKSTGIFVLKSLHATIFGVFLGKFVLLPL